MSDETTKPPPDYARMYRELDATDPKWRDKIEDRTGHRPGEPVTPQSPKDKLPTAKPGTPTVGQPNVPAPLPVGANPPKAVPKIPGLTEPATPGQGPAVKPTELPKANPGGTPTQPAPRTATAGKIGQPTTDERKVGTPAPSVAAQQSGAKTQNWVDKIKTGNGSKPGDDYLAKERLTSQQQAQSKALQDQKMRQLDAQRKTATTQIAQPAAPKAAPNPQGGKWTEKIAQERSKPKAPAPKPAPVKQAAPPPKPTPPAPRPPAPRGRGR